MAGIKFTTKDILEQDFKITMRGYNKDEVDEFLDDIIKDYDVYEAKVKALKAEIASLQAQLKGQAPSPQTNSSQSAPATDYSRSGSATNFDILKRINRLERAVFGSQVQDQ